MVFQRCAGHHRLYTANPYTANPFLGEASTIGGCFVGFVVPGAPEGSTGKIFIYFILFFFFFEKPAPVKYRCEELNSIYLS